jgi:hypothetical protein
LGYGSGTENATFTLNNLTKQESHHLYTGSELCGISVWTRAATNNNCDHLHQCFQINAKRTDIGKYSFVNRNTQLWNQLHADALGALSWKPSSVRKSIRKVINNPQVILGWK